MGVGTSMGSHHMGGNCTKQCWRRCFRSHLAAQYEQIEKSDEQAELYQVDWEVAKLRGLGAPCDICADQTRIATHAAPCGHAACEKCWEAWAESRCMLCNADIPEGGVMRAPMRVVPATKRELAPDEQNNTDKVELAVNRALTQLVRIKQLLAAVKAALQTVLDDVQRGSEDNVEAQFAVLQVNASCIQEQLQHLATLLQENNSGGSWLTCARSLEETIKEIEQLSKAHTLNSEDGSQVCALPACAQNECKTILQPRAKAGVWRGQWVAIQALQTEIFTEVMPNVLSSF